MTNPRTEAQLLRQEVEELTEMLQAKDVLEALRLSLVEKGFKISDLLLAGLVEDEDEHEWGAIVTKKRRIFLYERSTAHGKNGFISFNEEHDRQKAIARYPAVRAALESVGG